MAKYTEHFTKPNTDSVVIYKRLLRYVGEYWPLFILSVFGYTLYSSSIVLIADLMQFVLDSIGDSEVKSFGIVSGFMMHFFSWVSDDPESLPRILIPMALIGIVIIRGAGYFLGSYFIQHVARQVVHTLRCQLFEKLLVLPSKFFDQNPSGVVISKITYNVDQVAGSVSKALQVCIREFLIAVALLSYLIFLNWKLCLVFLAVAPFITVIVSYVGKRFRRFSRRIQESMGNVTQVSRESVNGFREVRIFGGREYELNRFTEASDYNRQQSMKMVLTGAVSTPLIQFIVAIALAVLFWLALDPKVIGEFTSGQFAAFIVAAGQMPKPIRQLSVVQSIIQRGLAAAEDIFDLLDKPSEIDQGKQYVDRVKGRIEFKDVSFAYEEGGEKVLDKISFVVEPGETVALVGRSGSGKTTLVSLLARFYQHDQGEILIDGINNYDYRLVNLREQISLVSQQVTLFNDTVKKNIAYGGLSGSDDEAIRQAAHRAYATEFIDKLAQGFDTVIGDDGLLLSGGQRQRLAIARALLKDAPILILDEATSSLDNESERFIQAALDAVMEGRTTFVVAHRLSTIENADRILVMDNGRIVESGDHATLLAAKGMYARLHHRQFDD